jgi:hypothetical protein
MRRLLTIALVVLASSAAAGCSTSTQSELTGDSDASKNAQVHFGEISNGMSISEVQGVLGTPDDTQHTEVAGLVTDCIYYGTPGDSSGWYQFCFDNGKLTSKSKN